jgi:hypothetical protein
MERRSAPAALLMASLALLHHISPVAGGCTISDPRVSCNGHGECDTDLKYVCDRVYTTQTAGLAAYPESADCLNVVPPGFERIAGPVSESELLEFPAEVVWATALCPGGRFEVDGERYGYVVLAKKIFRLLEKNGDQNFL